VQKTEDRFGFGFEINELSKNLTFFLTVFQPTVCNPQFKLTVTKNDFACIQCADKERFKTRQKQSLAYTGWVKLNGADALSFVIVKALFREF